ncbi:MAG: hypothetical protein DI626_03035 [Micavibrio aeruginosavorus]|uniref:Uncharacterized protein n=1 Tax=Micavibrio aeruginosavorus TaxID=349221 RepID=A0A2W5C1K1_9BACT|nr:MAG: hypothetical protein DI626_03035 [Micavibrio aeruginosavorus]
MIRFAVLIFFFIHLAILLKARHLRWVGHLTGWGTCALFIGLYMFQVEENSDIVFLVMAALTGISMIAAELVAKALKKDRP